MPQLNYLLIPALPILFLVIYQTILADLYAYQGLVKIELSVDFWILFILSTIPIMLVFPTRIERPSDLFLLFYLLISVVWGTVIWSGTGLVDFSDQPLFFLLTILPAVTIVAMRAPMRKYIFHYMLPVQLMSRSWLPTVFIVLVFFVALATYVIIGDGSFNWEEIYERRLAGRDAFHEHILAAYALNMTTNGILPLLGFIAGHRRSVILLAIALAFVMVMYFLLGLKSPAVNLAVLAALGFYARYNGLRRNLPLLVLSAIIIFYAVALFAFMFDESTFLVDYFVRRISMVQPQVQSYYFDYWIHRDVAELSLANAGQNFSDITFGIGYLYLDNPLTNANTNAFNYSLAKTGITAYLFCVFVVVFLIGAIDAMAEKTRGPEFFAISAIFAIMISEQALTVVLLSSGIALGFVILMLFSVPTRASAVVIK